MHAKYTGTYHVQPTRKFVEIFIMGKFVGVWIGAGKWEGLIRHNANEKNIILVYFIGGLLFGVSKCRLD